MVFGTSLSVHRQRTNKLSIVKQTKTDKTMAKYEIIDGVGIIPDGEYEVESDAFKGCADLKSVVIPDSVTEIGVDSFRNCTSLTSVVIPKNLSSIFLRTFAGCPNLKDVKVVAENPWFDSREGCNAIISTKSNELVMGFSSTVIPDSVVKICSSAFEDCTGLTSIFIPASVKEIDGNAFSGCVDLESVEIAEGGITKIGLGAFSGCEKLKSIVIPDGVTEIDLFTFSKCYALRSITLPVGVEKINEGFSESKELEAIYVPAGTVEYYRERLSKELHDKIVELK